MCGALLLSALQVSRFFIGLGPFAKVQAEVLLAGRSRDHEASPAEGAGLRKGHGQDKSGGRSGVEGVTPAFEIIGRECFF